MQYITQKALTIRVYHSRQARPARAVLRLKLQLKKRVVCLTFSDKIGESFIISKDGDYDSDYDYDFAIRYLLFAIFKGEKV